MVILDNKRQTNRWELVTEWNVKLNALARS